MGKRSRKRRQEKNRAPKPRSGGKPGQQKVLTTFWGPPTHDCPVCEMLAGKESEILPDGSTVHTIEGEEELLLLEQKMKEAAEQCSNGFFFSNRESAP